MYLCILMLFAELALDAFLLLYNLFLHMACEYFVMKVLKENMKKNTFMKIVFPTLCIS